MSDSTFGFIGLGLIGGSIARGLRRANKDITIMAYMRTRSKLEQAKADGTIDMILDGIDETLSACDVIFLCTPVEYNAVYLEKVRPFLKPGALITDIGSTKTDIHQAVERLGYEDVFVGGHPMAGSEKTGYESSTDHLLENAYYIITPTKKSTPEQIDRIRQVALGIGALPIVLDYHEHDFSVAAISNLCSAENRYERTNRILNRVSKERDLFLHQVADYVGATLCGDEFCNTGYGNRESGRGGAHRRNRDLRVHSWRPTWQGADPGKE